MRWYYNSIFLSFVLSFVPFTAIHARLLRLAVPQQQGQGQGQGGGTLPQQGQAEETLLQQEQGGQQGGAPSPQQERALSPELLRACSPEALRSVGYSGQKAKYLLGLAAAFASAPEPGYVGPRLSDAVLRALPEEELVAALVQVRAPACGLPPCGRWAAIL